MADSAGTLLIDDPLPCKYASKCTIQRPIAHPHFAIYKHTIGTRPICRGSLKKNRPYFGFRYRLRRLVTTMPEFTTTNDSKHSADHVGRIQKELETLFR